MRRYATIVVLCGVLAGCASTGSPPPDNNQPTDQIAVTVAGNANTSGNPADASRVVHANDYYEGINAHINAPSSTILDTLSGVYQDLGIPITTRMASTGQIGNRDYKVPGHSLNSIRISRIVDCGQGGIGGARADVDQIRLNVISTIKAAPDSGSVVNTYVSAVARPLTSSSDPARCASSGMLERLINDRLAKALGVPAPN